MGYCDSTVPIIFVLDSYSVTMLCRNRDDLGCPPPPLTALGTGTTGVRAVDEFLIKSLLVVMEGKTV